MQVITKDIITRYFNILEVLLLKILELIIRIDGEIKIRINVQVNSELVRSISI